VQTESAGLAGWSRRGPRGGVRLFKEVLTFEPLVIDSNTESLAFEQDARSPFRIILFDSEVNSFRAPNLFQSFQLIWPDTEFAIPEWWHPHAETQSDNSLNRRMKLARQVDAESLFSSTHDVVVSLVPSHGDYRITASTRAVSQEAYVPHPKFEPGARMAHSLVDSRGPLPGATFDNSLIPGAKMPPELQPDFPISPESDAFASDTDARTARARDPFIPFETGDFNTGTGPMSDGAHIERIDGIDVGGLREGNTPYFDNISKPQGFSQATFSPYILAPSAVTFGSIHSGVQDRVPWQTLLFRPGDPKLHYGANRIPDHSLLDLFRMPVVRGVQSKPPYFDEAKTISGRFFTEGKINLNYRMIPFHYIRRATALHALLKAEKVLAIPTDAVDRYKTEVNDSPWRHFIDADETLSQWEQKFSKGEIFRYESEICEMLLVPEGQTLERMESFWNIHRLTGDNVRERPYASLAPRVTTQSNSFEIRIYLRTDHREGAQSRNLTWQSALPCYV
jgi:uncharacterized protein (TIGR02600 family)